jgi:hypothetical protein
VYEALKALVVVVVVVVVGEVGVVAAAVGERAWIEGRGLKRKVISTHYIGVIPAPTRTKSIGDIIHIGVFDMIFKHWALKY